jgi:hypothetical protein
MIASSTRSSSSSSSSARSLSSVSCSSSFPFPDGRRHLYEVSADGETVYRGRSRSLAVGIYDDLRQDKNVKLVAVFLDGRWLHIKGARS